MTEKSSLDSYDMAILQIMAAAGRLPLTKLAQKIGLSKSPCQARVRRLEKEGYIAGYRALINPVRLGLNHIAFVEVKLNDTKAAALEAFNQAVIKISEVEQCHMIAGGFDYLLKVRTTDIHAYRQVMVDKISTLPHLAYTSTFVCMEAVKEDGLVQA